MQGKFGNSFTFEYLKKTFEKEQFDGLFVKISERGIRNGCIIGFEVPTFRAAAVPECGIRMPDFVLQVSKLSYYASTILPLLT